MIRTLLVDDEAPARERLRQLLDQWPDVDVVGEAADGEEALAKISDMQPDLVFLDIQMPGRNGMEVAASLVPPRPCVIFCTAFDRYAVDAFEQHAMDYLLKPVSRVRLEKALRRVRELVQAEQERSHELQSAAETQRRLFPHSRPSLTTLDYWGSCLPARGVGGDYYDFLTLGPHQLGIALGDVCGKGMAAALLMASLQGRLQSRALQQGRQVGPLVQELNRLMCDSTGSNRYVTFFYAVYDEQRRGMTCVNTGHHPPLLFRPDRQGKLRLVQKLETGGTAVGLFPTASYEEESVRLEPEDLLVLYTDGLTEARDRSGEEFGEEGLVEAIRRGRCSTAEQWGRFLLSQLGRFSQGVPYTDDLTLVVLRGRDSA